MMCHYFVGSNILVYLNETITKVKGSTKRWAGREPWHRNVEVSHGWTQRSMTKGHVTATTDQRPDPRLPPLVYMYRCSESSQNRTRFLPSLPRRKGIQSLPLPQPPFVSRENAGKIKKFQCYLFCYFSRDLFFRIPNRWKI